MKKQQSINLSVGSLLQGKESKAMIDCLLGGTKIDSERKINALHSHFVDNVCLTEAAKMHSLPQPNLTDAIEALNKVACVCERFHEIKMHSKIYTS